MHYQNSHRDTYSEVDLFSNKGRLGRKRYFVYSIIIPLLFFWGIASVAGVTKYLPIESTALFNGILGLALLAMVFMFIQLTIQRCHDFNKSAWYALLALIPFSNFIFALIPGTNGLNQYGNRAEPASIFFKIMLYVLILLLLVLFAYLAVNFSSLFSSLFEL